MRDEFSGIELGGRAQYLFKTLMERYIADGQPVGSRTLARDTGLDLSPATIRNVMADLEDLGLIKSPHTSAGRVPTVQGYRIFVDSMVTWKKPSSADRKRLAGIVDDDDDVRRMLENLTQRLSEVTRLAGLVMLPKADAQALRQVEFLPLGDNRVLGIMVLNDKEVQNRVIQTDRPYTESELTQAANYLNTVFAGRDIKQVKEKLVAEMASTRDEMNRMMQAVIEMSAKCFVSDDSAGDYFLAGQTNLMDISDLSSIDKLRSLFEAFNQKRDILHLLDQALNAEGVQIFIGDESGYEALDECSIVTATYGTEGDTFGVLGVIGPTRMKYERVVPIVDLTARMLGSALKNPT